MTAALNKRVLAVGRNANLRHHLTHGRSAYPASQIPSTPPGGLLRSDFGCAPDIWLDGVTGAVSVLVGMKKGQDYSGPVCAASRDALFILLS